MGFHQNRMDRTNRWYCYAKSLCLVEEKISPEDEALAEAYIQTNYTQLTDDDFERTLKKYALFKYMEDNGLLEE